MRARLVNQFSHYGCGAGKTARLLRLRIFPGLKIFLRFRKLAAQGNPMLIKASQQYPMNASGKVVIQQEWRKIKRRHKMKRAALAERRRPVIHPIAIHSTVIRRIESNLKSDLNLRHLTAHRLRAAKARRRIEFQTRPNLPALNLQARNLQGRQFQGRLCSAARLHPTAEPRTMPTRVTAREARRLCFIVRQTRAISRGDQHNRMRRMKDRAQASRARPQMIMMMS
jgi:hypothetical protein